MVSSGMYSDRRGPKTPLLLGLTLFIAGLVIGGLAPAMWVLVGARFLQGLATGLLITAMYVTMGEVYPDAIRPRIFAALATAWVVPGLVGPVAAGWITQNFSWRWVFGGLAPFVALGGLLMLPSLRQLRTHTADGATTDLARLGYALLTAVGIAGVANIGENQQPVSIAIAVAGAAALAIGIRRLLPRGTFGFAAGVPAAVAYRGVLAGTFFGMEALVPLTLTVQHHYSPTMSGTPLMLTAVTWALASYLQGRWRRPNRPLLVRTGLILSAVAGVGMALVATRTVPGWAAFVVWPVAGLGAGFALTSTSVVLLEFTNDADRGSDSSSLQLADSSASALCTAFGGAMVAAAAHGSLSYAHALSSVFIAMGALGVLALFRTGRLRSHGTPLSEADAAAARVEPAQVGSGACAP
jgi:sugar phosphate permease